MGIELEAHYLLNMGPFPSFCALRDGTLFAGGWMALWALHLGFRCARVPAHHRAVCTPTKELGDGSGESAHRKSPDPHGAGLPLED
jgi:hypothetical protein